MRYGDDRVMLEIAPTEVADNEHVVRQHMHKSEE